MGPSLSRRRLLHDAAALASTGLLVGEGEAAAPKPPVPYRGKKMSLDPGSPSPLPVVDTHQHLWDLDRFRLPWLAGAPQINHSFRMEDYLQATAHVNVVKTVYMEVNVEPSQWVAEADYVIDLCARHDNPMAAAVIGGDPAAPDFGTFIGRYRNSPYIKGVRAGVPPYTGGRPPKEFLNGIHLLGRHGMSFDLNVPPDRLAEGARLVEACPETRFILDHCGNANVQAADRAVWQQGIDGIARHKHAVCKVSGIVASAKPGAWHPADLQPIVRHVIDAFGWDRVMFGGDWPVCTRVAPLQDWAEALLEIVRYDQPALQRKLFYDNAVRFYGLK